MSVSAEKKTEIIEDNARAKGDTGSPEVQVAILTSRILPARRAFTKVNANCLTHVDKSRTLWHKRGAAASAIGPQAAK